MPAYWPTDGPSPDVSCTPGVLDPAMKQSNIDKNVRVPGWTKTVRPRVSHTNPPKLALKQSYGERGSP